MSFLEKYNAFVRGNSVPVKTFEQALRNASYVLHGRFNESDLVAELIYAASSALGLYHDSLFLKPTAPPAVALADRDAISSAASFSTRSIFASSSAYRLLAYGIALTQSFELLIEMAAVRYLSEQNRLRLVALIESFKFVCRLLILRLNGGQMLPASPLPESSRTDDGADAADPSATTAWKGKRTNVSAAPLATFTRSVGEAAPSSDPLAALLSGTDAPAEGESESSKTSAAASFVESHAILPLKGAASIFSPLKGSLLLSEVLFHARPVIYALAAAKFGRRSWTPWLLSLATDAASWKLAEEATAAPGAQKQTKTEKSERQRRHLLLGYYVLRSPFFAEFIAPTVKPFADGLANTRFISMLGNSLNDYIDMCLDYQLYTAAS